MPKKSAWEIVGRVADVLGILTVTYAVVLVLLQYFRLDVSVLEPSGQGPLLLASIGLVVVGIGVAVGALASIGHPRSKYGPDGGSTDTKRLLVGAVLLLVGAGGLLIVILVPRVQ